MKQKNNKNTVKITFLLSLYYYFLFWLYENLTATRWSYQGFLNEMSDVSFYSSILGFSFTTFTYIFFNRKREPSAIVMNLFNLLFFIPMYVFMAFKQSEDGFLLYLTLYQFALFVFYIFIPFSFKPILKPNKTHFKLILGLILLFTLFINGYYNGFKLKLNLIDVYDNRLAVREMSIPTIFEYIKSSSYLVGIIALMYAMKIKNWFLIIFVILIQLMCFAFGGSKTQFFSIFICILGFIFYSDRFRLWALISLIGLLTIAISEYKFLGSTLISDIGIRRSLFVPPKISYDMFEFFETPGREYLYLRGSILRFFGFEDPYAAQQGFQRMIGKMYGGSEDTNANTGLLGNDYAQLGWLSLLVFPFVRVYILKLYDYCAIGIDKRIMAVLSIFVAFAFISGAFFSVLITNAVLLLCYLLYCFPGKKV